MTTDTVTVKHTWRQEGTIMLRDDERIDDLQRNHYGIIQRKGAFCFGMDAVLLSGFAVVKKGEKVLGPGNRHRHHSYSSYRQDRGKPLYRPGDTGRVRGHGQEERGI